MAKSRRIPAYCHHKPTGQARVRIKGKDIYLGSMALPIPTTATVEIARGRRILVTFDRRSHNPILREARLDERCPPIPWLSNHHVEFSYA